MSTRAFEPVFTPGVDLSCLKNIRAALVPGSGESVRYGRGLGCGAGARSYRGYPSASWCYWRRIVRNASRHSSLSGPGIREARSESRARISAVTRSSAASVLAPAGTLMRPKVFRGFCGVADFYHTTPRSAVVDSQTRRPPNHYAPRNAVHCTNYHSQI